MKERVQKLLAQADVASRRGAEDFIRDGRVRINGQIAQLGAKADPQKDTIEVDGVKLKFDKLSHTYIALYKPINVLSTNEGHKGDDRRTVRELVPQEGHLFTIGRLDADSEGLMVLTNDGDLTNKLAHPRYGHTKTYKAIVYGIPTGEILNQWRSGVYLEEGKTAPCFVEVTQHGGGLATLKIVMTEGKKRQIRRVASMLGFPVKRLTRTHIGKLGLGKLRPGDWIALTKDDVVAMRTPADEAMFIRKESKRPAPFKRSKPAEKPRGRTSSRRTNNTRPRRKRSS